MINIQKSQIVYYQQDRKSITVYFDFDKPDQKLYVVPTPRLVYSEYGPVFSLTKYKKNDGVAYGVCTFDVELAIPDAALQAVKEQFPAYVIGQFDWTSVQTFLLFDMEGESMELVVTPSMYGNNKATFAVELTSDVMLQTFINAFHSGDEAVSPFQIRYEVNSLTKLTGVSAKVSYNAEIAVSYEKKISTKKDTWGNKKDIVVDVKKNLRESGAGSVLVDWNIEKTPEAEQRVNDWAWTTLETLVANAVAIAQKAATLDNPLEATASFVQEYKENQVIEWSIATSDALLRFDDDTWNKIYTEVDLRELVVTFNLLGTFSGDGGETPISKVEITINYPTRETTTFSLIPTSGNENSFVYTAPGSFSPFDKQFDDKFTYRYKVLYNDKEPYESDWIESRDKVINITPNLLGVRTVSFVGADIPFVDENNVEAEGKRVKRLLIDFYYNRPEGVPNKVEQKVMTANSDDEKSKVTFTSFYNLPLENTYSYRYTFHYEDNSVLYVETQQNFGSENRDQLLVIYPYVEQEFTLRVRKIKDSKDKIVLVDLTAIYKDLDNNVTEKHTFDWEPPYKDDKTLMTAPAWNFFAPKNLEGGFYDFKGEIFFENDSFPVNNLKLQAVKNSLTLDAEHEPYSIIINSSQIDWNAVSQVQVDVFQTKNSGDIEEELKPYYRTVLPAGMISNTRLRQLAEENKYNQDFFNFIKPVEGTKDKVQFYNISRARADTSITFFLSVSYYQIDGSIKYLGEAEIKDKLQFIIPANGNSTTSTFIKKELSLIEEPKAESF